MVCLFRISRAFLIEFMEFLNGEREEGVLFGVAFGVELGRSLVTEEFFKLILKKKTPKSQFERK